MNAELRKRLEEAAEEYTESQDYMELENEFLMDEEGTCITRIYRGEQVEDSFLAGALQGYKEAVEQAKKWLKDLCERVGFTGMTINQTADTFETDMNKLWEEKK